MSADHSSYRRAYDSLVDQLLSDLSIVDSTSAAMRFAREAARSVRRSKQQVPQFYEHEFINLFKDALVASIRHQTGALEEQLHELQAQADIATVELSAQMEAARAARDQEAEHRLWQAREQTQREVDRKKRAVDEALETVAPRLDAFQRLTAELGITLS